MHGASRGTSGFSISEGLSEFRALRASVLRLWRESNLQLPPVVIEDLVRFNEAIDQAVAESFVRYTAEAERTVRLFDTLLSSSRNFNFIVDATGKLLHANRAMAGFFKFSLCEIPGKEIAGLHGPLMVEIQRNFYQVANLKLPHRTEKCVGVRPGRT